MKFHIPPLPEDELQHQYYSDEAQPLAVPIVKLESHQLLGFSECIPQRYEKSGGSVSVVIGGSRNNCLYVMGQEARQRFIKKTLLGVNKDQRHVYVKNTHSNESTSSEVTAAKLFSLTGLAAPYTVYADGFEANPELAKAMKKRKDKKTSVGVPNYCVASQRLKGYQDFSTFIDTMHQHQETFFPDQYRRTAFCNSYYKYKELCEREDTNHADIKLKKRDCLMNIYEVMPTQIKDMVDEMYVISMWLGNWDMFNFDLMNMGFTVITKKDGSKDVQPAGIDFGNCLKMGFGGMHKEDSVQSANLPAKIRPEAVRKPEFGFLSSLVTMCSSQRAREFIPESADFDPPILPEAQIQTYSASFDENPIPLLGTIPRRLPFQEMFKSANSAVLHHLSDKGDVDQPKLSQGFLRGLQRLSQISDRSINDVVGSWYMPQGLNYLSDNPEKQCTPKQMATLMQSRRDRIVSLFAKPLESYRRDRKNIMEILEIKRDMNNACTDLTGRAQPIEGAEREF